MSDQWSVISDQLFAAFGLGRQAWQKICFDISSLAALKKAFKN